MTVTRNVAGIATALSCPLSSVAETVTVVVPPSDPAMVRAESFTETVATVVSSENALITWVSSTSASAMWTFTVVLSPTSSVLSVIVPIYGGLLSSSKAPQPKKKNDVNRMVDKVTPKSCVKSGLNLIIRNLRFIICIFLINSFL